jgi:hypothetical protein
MRRAVTFTYAGGAAGYAAAVMVYGPETDIQTQQAYAKTFATPASGSGYSSKVEIWYSTGQIKRYVKHYAQNLDSISQN